MAIKVLLADESKIVRDAIRTLIQLEAAPLEIVGEASDFSEAIKIIEQLKLEIAILDVHMPVGSAIPLFSVADRIRSCGVRVVLLSICLDAPTLELAKLLGAPFFVDKLKLTEELIPAIRSLARNRALSELDTEEGGTWDMPHPL